MLKNLKSLFIVEEEEQKSKPEKSDNAKPSNPQSSSPSRSVSHSTTRGAGKVDSSMVDRLLEAIEKNNLDGFDYLEYKRSLKALDKMNMDEATKYRSAFATAATMGVTLEKLVETAEFYVNVLGKESMQFGKAVSLQLKEKVTDREKELVQFESIIKEKSEQIKQLTDEISKHQKQIEEIRNGLSGDKLKIEKTRADFTASYVNLKDQFQVDIDKMKEYLK